MSESYYKDLASSTQFLAEPNSIPSNPQEAKTVALKDIDDRGVSVETKADGIEAWERFNTTFPQAVYLTKDFDQKELEVQVILLWHEIVHLRQYEGMTPQTFYEHYVFAEGRWALEVQAYREGFRVMRLLGLSEEKLREAMNTQAERLYENYLLEAIPKHCALEGAVSVWLRDAP